MPFSASFSVSACDCTENQRLNRRLLFSVAQKILPCSATKGKLQRINNHGFAGTRFARQNIQPISKGDFCFP